MALVFTIKDAVFENYITILTPPANPFSWYKFGKTFADSVRDVSGNGRDMTALGASTGITYTNNSIILPQTSVSANCIQLAGLVASSYTQAISIKSGQNERAGLVPIGVSYGLVVGSDNRIGLKVKSQASGDFTLFSASAINRPASIVVSVDASVPSKVTLRLATKDKFGTITNIEQTFDGSLSSDYAGQPLRFGNNTVGSLEMGELIFYSEALPSSSMLNLLEYISQ